MNHEINSTHTNRSPRWLGLVACSLAIGCACALAACSSDDSAATVPANTEDAAVGAAGSAGAAGADAATGEEAATPEASVQEAATEAGIACEPQSVAGWTATWHPPTGMYQGKCAPGAIPTIMEACFASTATKTKCDNASKDYSDCLTCMLSNDTDASWGPVVKFTDLRYYDRNDSGCYALLEGDVSANGCGAKIQAYWECVQESCSPGCKIEAATFTKDMAAFNGCATKAAADPAICKTHMDEFKACFAADPKYQVCVWKSGEPLDHVLDRISELMCGMAPDPDAGTSDAATD